MHRLKPHSVIKSSNMLNADEPGPTALGKSTNSFKSNSTFGNEVFSEGVSQSMMIIEERTISKDVAALFAAEHRVTYHEIQYIH